MNVSAEFRWWTSHHTQNSNFSPRSSFFLLFTTTRYWNQCLILQRKVCFWIQSFVLFSLTQREQGNLRSTFPPDRSAMDFFLYISYFTYFSSKQLHFQICSLAYHRTRTCKLTVACSLVKHKMWWDPCLCININCWRTLCKI